MHSSQYGLLHYNLFYFHHSSSFSFYLLTTLHSLRSPEHVLLISVVVLATEEYWMSFSIGAHFLFLYKYISEIRCVFFNIFNFSVNRLIPFQLMFCLVFSFFGGKMKTKTTSSEKMDWKKKFDAWVRVMCNGHEKNKILYAPTHEQFAFFYAISFPYSSLYFIGLVRVFFRCEHFVRQMHSHHAHSHVVSCERSNKEKKRKTESSQ